LLDKVSVSQGSLLASLLSVLVSLVAESGFVSWANDQKYFLNMGLNALATQ
jgi:hypothetical protein